jgi:hypothetical protein
MARKKPFFTVHTHPTGGIHPSGGDLDYRRGERPATPQHADRGMRGDQQPILGRAVEGSHPGYMRS